MEVKMKKKFKKGTDVEGMGNEVLEWVDDSMGHYEDEKGLLKKDIIIEIK